MIDSRELLSIGWAGTKGMRGMEAPPPKNLM